MERLQDVMRKARNDAGLSMREMEAISGISKARLSRYENGFIQPRVDTLVRWAAALDLKASLLLKRAGL